MEATKQLREILIHWQEGKLLAAKAQWNIIVRDGDRVITSLSEPEPISVSPELEALLREAANA